MSSINEHRLLIGQPADGLDHLGYLLSTSDRKYLEKYGAWLKALADGDLHPITSEQEYFVGVVRGINSPKSWADELWLRWMVVYEPWKRSLDLAVSEQDKQVEWGVKPQLDSSAREYVASYYLLSVCAACGSNSPNLCRCSE